MMNAAYASAFIDCFSVCETLMPTAVLRVLT